MDKIKDTLFRLQQHDVTSPLPCPFCGSETEIQTTNFGDDATDYYRVKCKQKEHALDWWEKSKDEAIAVWNERSCLSQQGHICLMNMDKHKTCMVCGKQNCC